MAGAKNFINNPGKIRYGYEGVKKPKAINCAFDKYRIYNTSKWRGKNGLRHKKLREKPVCEVCGNTLATEVDHIIPFSTGLTDRQKLKIGFNYNNLQSICHECHMLKHGKFNKTVDYGI